MTAAKKTQAANTRTTSIQSERLQSGFGSRHIVSAKGVTTRTPPAPPIHHVHHLSKMESHGNIPPTYRLAVPRVHPTRHIDSAIAMKMTEYLKRSNGFRS